MDPNNTTSPQSPVDTDDTTLNLEDDSLSVPMRELGTESIPYEVLRLIPEESARFYKFVPLSVTDGVLEVGMVDPNDIKGIDALNFISRKTGTPFKLFRVSEEDFEKVMEMYRGLGSDVDRAITDMATQDNTKLAEQDTPESLDLGSSINRLEKQSTAVNDAILEDAPAIKLVSTILRYAIDGHASDIHIEPSQDGVRVRYRVDGILHTSVVLPASSHRAIVARVKVLASIRLDEKRKPQDGRFSATIDGRKIDFRVSTFPAYNGEKVVMRILDRNQGFISLDTLGLSPRNLSLIRNAIVQPHGLVLISGPTGSGKSTTLYSMLSEVDRNEQNVLSLEDPVEYYIDGVSQSQVRPEIGYTFANGLRTTLRQDPDVIMVGEIRDGETAKLAIQAALTGHLVISTIHTNSAVGVIPRLIDMGVEPYLIPPTLICTVAQRLVRKLCPDTGKAIPVTPSMRSMLERQLADLPERYRPQIPDTVYEAERSATCPSGTRGRTAVVEVVEMTPEMEKAILTAPIESELWKVARAQGVVTMQEDAMIKAFAKEIPFAEVNTLGSALGLIEDEVVEEKSATVPEPPPIVLDAAVPETEADVPPEPPAL
jgi:type IV pilus assembly protein PilB